MSCSARWVTDLGIMSSGCSAATRPLKAKIIEAYRSQYDIDGRLPECVEVGNAVVLPLKRCPDECFEYGYGGVVKLSGEYVGLSASEDRIGKGYTVGSSFETEDKTVAYCGFFNPQWGHFLFETLSRLWFCGKEGYEHIDEYVFITDTGNDSVFPTGNFAALFRMLGILDRVRIVSRPTAFAKVVVPQETFVLAKRINKAFLSVIERIVSAVPVKAGVERKKIMLGRSLFPKARRYELGIERLERYFQTNGYELLHPEQMEPDKLIEAFASAEEIVTFSGSAAHNLLFAPCRCRVAVIEKYPYVNYYQTAVDLLRDLDVTYVDANAYIRPVDVGLGPFVLCTNDCFRAYCTGRGLPQPEELSETLCRKQLRRYLHLYTREYGSRWIMPEWLEEHRPLMEEAFSDSRRFYDEASAGLLCKLYCRISPRNILRRIYRIFRLSR